MHPGRLASGRMCVAVHGVGAGRLEGGKQGVGTQCAAACSSCSPRPPFFKLLAGIVLPIGKREEMKVRSHGLRHVGPPHQRLAGTQHPATFPTVPQQVTKLKACPPPAHCCAWPVCLAPPSGHTRSLQPTRGQSQKASRRPREKPDPRPPASQPVEHTTTRGLHACAQNPEQD